MAPDRQIARRNITTAYALAVLVDLIQIPANFAFFASFLTGIGILAVDTPIEVLTRLSTQSPRSSSWAYWASIGPSCLLSSLNLSPGLTPLLHGLPAWRTWFTSVRSRDVSLSAQAEHLTYVTLVLRAASRNLYHRSNRPSPS